MKVEAVELLACPTCRNDLQLDGAEIVDSEVQSGALRCPVCETTYQIEGGSPRLMPCGVPVPRWHEWEEKQELGLQEYEELEASGSQDAVDRTAAAFGAFCALKGTILDVGCGITASPEYAIRPSESLYIGVDPLPGASERTFEFVEAVGEQLPFRAATFDVAVSATSLDHVAAPELVLAEVRRVLKPSGRFALWIGVLDEKYFERMYAMPSFRDPVARQELTDRLKSADVRRLTSAAWSHLVLNRVRSASMRLRRLTRRQLPVEEVFKDRGRYHFRFYTESEVRELLHESGFRVTKQRLVKDASGNSLFMLASVTELGAG